MIVTPIVATNKFWRDQFVGHAWGCRLALWINATGMTPRFHSALGAAFTLESSLRADKRQAQNKLNEMLAAFSFTPVVLLSGVMGSLVGWRDSKRERKEILREALEIVGSGDSEACRLLLQVLEVGRLWALKKCACSKWFFASKKDQVSCSASCGKLKHETTTAYRDQRNRRRRNRYAQDKDQVKQWLMRT
jgi:hypothetical protein